MDPGRGTTIITAVIITTLTLIIAAGIAPDITAARRHHNRNRDTHPLGAPAERMATERDR